MKMLLLAAAAASSVLPAFAGSCIVSGAIARPCASAAYAVAPEVEVRASTSGWGPRTGLPELEARAWWLAFADPFAKFRSDEPSGFMLYIR